MNMNYKWKILGKERIVYSFSCYIVILTLHQSLRYISGFSQKQAGKRKLNGILWKLRGEEVKLSVLSWFSWISFIKHLLFTNPLSGMITGISENLVKNNLVKMSIWSMSIFSLLFFNYERIQSEKIIEQTSQHPPCRPNLKILPCVL